MGKEKGRKGGSKIGEKIHWEEKNKSKTQKKKK